MEDALTELGVPELVAWYGVTLVAMLALTWFLLRVIRRSARRGDDPEAILAERLARGELSAAEYEELVATLRRARDA